MAEQEVKTPVFVDDDLDFLDTIKCLQDDFGLQGHVTSDTEEALSLVRGGNISVFICDQRMPGQQDGISVIQQVRNVDPNVKLVILTGYELTDEQKNIVESLGGKVCSKCEDLKDLLDSIVAKDTSKKEPSTVIHLQTKVSKLERLNRAWTSHLVNELEEIEGLEDAWVACAGSNFTVKELIDDIQSFNPRGIKHIKLWIDAQERLREIRRSTKRRITKW